MQKLVDFKISTRTDIPKLPFLIDEFINRIQNVREEMKRRDIDILLITEPENIYYLTGMQTVGDPPINALILPIEDYPYYYTRELERSNVNFRTFLSKGQCKAYQDFEDPYEGLLREIINRGHSRKIISIEEKSRKHKPYLLMELRNKFKRAVIDIDGSDVVANFRLVKSDSEIAKIEAAGEITFKGMLKMIKATIDGTSENKIASEGYKEMFELGSTYAGYPIFVSSGPHGALGHAASDTRKINKGDVVFLELTGIVDRYACPIMRTVYIGEKLPKWLELIETAIDKAVSEAIINMKEGTRCCEIDTITRDIINECSNKIKEFGYKLTQKSRSAYSVGVNFMVDWGEGEHLSFDPSEYKELKEGMVFHLIPWVQVFDNEDNPICGVGLSETVLVTKNGGVSFFEKFKNKLPRKIILSNERNNFILNSIPGSGFASDNYCPVHPNVLDSIKNQNSLYCNTYGKDFFTEQAKNLIEKFIGKKCDPYIVTSGTAANVLAISEYVNKSDLVICAEDSHLYWDECGALQSWTGCQVYPIRNNEKKINVEMLTDVINKFPDICHRSKPRLVSISQPTEFGLIYSRKELDQIMKFCFDNDLFLHIDGTRLFNAIVSSDMTISEMLDGVDVLTLGFTKNGALDAETIIFLNDKHLDFDRKIKQFGQLKSKIRYTSVQIITLLENNLCLNLAKNANSFSKRLYRFFVDNNFNVIETNSNILFLKTDNENLKNILVNKYNLLTNFKESFWNIRFVTSWNINENDIEELFNILKSFIDKEIYHNI